MPQPIMTHRVVVSNKVVGHLHNRGQQIWLDWTNGYWEDPSRPVLGLAFEDNPRGRVSSSTSLPPWFGHLLPEGVLRRWVADDARVSMSAELPLLLRLGHDLPGAVQILPVEGAVDPSWHPDEEVRPVRPAGVTGAGLRFSLAGVALKFSMVQRADRLVVPAHDEDGDWIVKMPDAVYPGVPHNEYAMMAMAQQVGIDVPDLRLVHRDLVPDPGDNAWPGGQEWAYAIRRFDRPAPRVRVHIEDLAQVRGVAPGDAKYAGSYETVANILYSVVGLEGYLEFVRRLFFSYAIGNGDMHLKNISVVYPDGRRPTLSPGYDMVCTAPYGFEGSDELALKIGGSRRFATVAPDTFTAMAARVGAPVEATRAVVHDAARGLPDAWTQVEEDLVVLPRHREWLKERLPRLVRDFG